MKNSKLKEKYFAPTPAKWRKLGDALLGVSTTITGFAIMDQMKGLALTALILGVVGKFLTNFFTKENTSNDVNA